MLELVSKVIAGIPRTIVAERNQNLKEIKSIFNETYRNISLYNPCHENVIVMVNIMDAEKTILL